MFAHPVVLKHRQIEFRFVVYRSMNVFFGCNGNEIIAFLIIVTQKFFQQHIALKILLNAKLRRLEW